MPFRSLVPRLPAQTLQIYQKNILGISTICLWYFFEKSSILNKIAILGQAPSGRLQAPSAALRLAEPNK